jgi:hypothetical protein
MTRVNCCTLPSDSYMLCAGWWHQVRGDVCRRINCACLYSTVRTKPYCQSRLIRVLDAFARSRKARKGSPYFTPLKPLAHIHHILIYAVIFGLTPFGWLCYIMLNHTLFLKGISFFIYAFYQEHIYGVKEGPGVIPWSYPSIRLSACIRVAPTGWIYVKFGNGEFYKKYFAKTQFWLKSGTNFGHFTWRPNHVLLLESPKTLSLRVEVYQAVHISKAV